MIFVRGCDSVLIIHFLDDRSIGKREKRERELCSAKARDSCIGRPRSPTLLDEWLESFWWEKIYKSNMFQPCSNTHGRTTCYNWTLPLLTLLHFTHWRFLGWLLGRLDQLTLVPALKCVRKRCWCGCSTAPPSRIWSRLIAFWPIPYPLPHIKNER